MKDFNELISSIINKFPGINKEGSAFIRNEVSLFTHGTIHRICKAMSKALQARDSYTGEHCRRVAVYASKLADDEELGLNDDMKTALSCACTIHDIGKVQIHDAILSGDIAYNRNDPQQKEEFFRFVGNHPECGAKILSHAFRFLSSNQNIIPLLVLYHHWDYNTLDPKSGEGKGYPSRVIDDKLREYINSVIYEHEGNFLNIKEYEGVDKNKLRILVGICRVADSLDAGTVTRKYKSGDLFKPMGEIIDEIIGGGAIYHPDVVASLEKRRTILENMNLSLVANNELRNTPPSPFVWTRRTP